MAFAFAKIASSVCCAAAEMPTSQIPQLVETTCPGLSATMRLYMVVKSAFCVDADM
jgi:hypothetical protein